MGMWQKKKKKRDKCLRSTWSCTIHLSTYFFLFTVIYPYMQQLLHIYITVTLKQKMCSFNLRAQRKLIKKNQRCANTLQIYFEIFYNKLSLCTMYSIILFFLSFFCFFFLRKMYSITLIYSLCVINLGKEHRFQLPQLVKSLMIV